MDCLGNINYVFFEEFKRLDKLCGEIYGGSHGVTAYIDRMKGIKMSESRCISGWETDLKQLCRLRHMRNHLAHDGSFEEALSTQADVTWLAAFYDRILQGKDPLTMLRQMREHSRSKAVPRAYAARKKSGSGCSATTVAGILFVFLTAILFVYWLVQ